MSPRKPSRKHGEDAEPRQLSLFEAPPEVTQPSEDGQDKTLEQIASQPVPPINERENYGVTFEELASFRSTPRNRGALDRNILMQNYRGIQLAYSGMQNMESFDGLTGVPHEMLVRMKPAEIVALYLRIAEVKINGNNQDLAYTPLENFGSVIANLVERGYNYHGMRVMFNKKSNRTRAGKLTERIQTIMDEDKKRFLNSLYLPFRKPGEKGAEYEYPFRDPHPEDLADFTGIDTFRRRFSEKMQMVYLGNTKGYDGVIIRS